MLYNFISRIFGGTAFVRKRQSRKHKVDERGILLITYAEWPRQLG